MLEALPPPPNEVPPQPAKKSNAESVTETRSRHRKFVRREARIAPSNVRVFRNRRVRFLRRAKVLSRELKARGRGNLPSCNSATSRRRGKVTDGFLRTISLIAFSLATIVSAETGGLLNTFVPGLLRSKIGSLLQFLSTTDPLVADVSRGADSTKIVLVYSETVINPPRHVVYCLHDIPKHTSITR